MALIETNAALDMNSLDTFYGVVTAATPSQITITAGQLEGTYRGSFSFDQFGRVFGQLNSYETKLNGVVESKFSQLSVDAFTAFNAINSNNAVSLLPSALSGDDTIIGSNFNDALLGFSGNDEIQGGLGDDEIRGDAGTDRLYGQRGNDILNGGSGPDLLFGGLGIDTAAYSGIQSSHTIELGVSATTVSDRRADGDGTDTLTNIELLDFAGETFDLSKFGGTAGLSEQNFEAFIELYIAYFNRAPDAVGLNFWGSAFANGMSLDEIAAEFAPQPETVATYPEGTSNTEFVTTVYNNILGRGPDQGGLDFWVNGLEEGGLTRDTFFLKLLGGVEDGNSDRTYLDNKVDIGAYFAVHKGMSDGENAKAVMDLFGDQDVSNTSGAKAAIDDYYADALDPTNGEFLLQVVGVLDDPFSVA